jgi:hypothetical protein
MTRWLASTNERSAMTMRTRPRMIRPLAACGVILAFVAVVLALHGRVQAQAPRANQPSTKVELLFVQNATSGSFDGKTLTLKSVGPTLYFSDRPERITGQLRTSEFVGHWTKGADSFASNPPNATLSVFGAKEVNSSVVVLTNPKLDGNTLSYTVKILEGKPPASFKESSLFIDIFGRWRMAAMGMAVGETRGYQEGEQARAPAPAPAYSGCSGAGSRGAAGARTRDDPDGQPGRGRGEAQRAQVAPQPGLDQPGSVRRGLQEAPRSDHPVTTPATWRPKAPRASERGRAVALDSAR